MNSNTAQEQVGERDPRRWLTLITLCLSTLVLVIDAQVLTVAIPALTEDLGATGQDVQWINASYLLVLAGLLLTGGSLSDRFGRRRAMLAGLVLFGIASLAAAYAPSAAALIAARAGMGVGAALVLPSTLSILITVFDETERPKAIAAWSAVAMVGLVGGPVLGGFLITHLWWGSVFLINVPVAALAFIAALVLMPESRGPQRRPDVVGAALSIVAMAALVWTIISLPEHGLTASLAATAIVGAVALVAFGVWERRSAAPMVPLQLFRERNFSGSCFSLTLIYLAYGGMLLALTQYLQFVLRYTPIQAGLALLPMALALTAAAAAGSTLGKRFGNRAMMTAGFVVMAVGFVLLARLSADSGYLVPAIAMTLLGIGAGLAQLTAVAAMMATVPEDHAGVGSAVNDTMQQTGSTLGIAVLGSILTAGFTAAMPPSAPDEARASIGQALAVANNTGNGGLAEAAREAFTSGMSVTFIIAAVLVLGAAALSLIVVRDVAGEDTGDDEPARDEEVADDARFPGQTREAGKTSHDLVEAGR